MWVNQRPSTQSLGTRGFHACVRLDVSVLEAERSKAKGRSHKQRSGNPAHEKSPRVPRVKT